MNLTEFTTRKGGNSAVLPPEATVLPIILGFSDLRPAKFQHSWTVHS